MLIPSLIFYMSCKLQEEVVIHQYNITINNLSANNIEVSFYPDKLEMGNGEVKNYKSVDLKAGQAASYTVSYKESVAQLPSGAGHMPNPMTIDNPNFDVQKISMLSTDTGDMIKELVTQPLQTEGYFIKDIPQGAIINWTLDITDELLNSKANGTLCIVQ